jgi:hypothetical protein
MNVRWNAFTVLVGGVLVAALWRGTLLSAQTGVKAAPDAFGTLSDGQPDVQGYWNQRNMGSLAGGGDADVVATYSLERGDEDRREQVRITGGGAVLGRPIVDPPSGLIPYEPWAEEKYHYLVRVHKDPSSLQDFDPAARGFLEGPPRINYQSGFQIIQAAGRVVFVYEYGHTFRSIPLDGRPHLPADMKLWMGDSRGHWEGHTLVVDVTNNNDQMWLDEVGAFHGTAMHVVERWTFASPDILEYEATIDEPGVFTQPWKIGLHFVRVLDKTYEQMESAVWEGNRAEELSIRRTPPSSQETAESKEAAK